MQLIRLLILSWLAFACTHSDGEKNVAHRNNPEFPELLERPEALRHGQEWDEVQNFYGAQCKALRENPQDHDARLKLVECFIQEARVTGEHPHYYPAALTLASEVIRALEPKKDMDVREQDLLFRALTHQASLQLSLHDFAAAKITAEKAAALNPYNAYIMGCLVDAHVELGDYARAVEYCDKMVGIRPDLRSYARVSYLREIFGDLPGAIEAMKMAVSAGFPGYEQTEWARLQLGNLYEKQGNLQEAEAQYQTCLAARENYPFAIAALAGLEIQRGNDDKALQLLQQAADIIPEIGFYIDIAKIHARKNDRETLTRLLPDIETMFREDMEAGHNMALEAARFQLEIKKDPNAAFELLRDEVARRPHNIEVNKLLGDIYTALGKTPEARAAFNNARPPKLPAAS